MVAILSRDREELNVDDTTKPTHTQQIVFIWDIFQEGAMNKVCISTFWFISYGLPLLYCKPGTKSYTTIGYLQMLVNMLVSKNSIIPLSYHWLIICLHYQYSSFMSAQCHKLSRYFDFNVLSHFCRNQLIKHVPSYSNFHHIISTVRLFFLIKRSAMIYWPGP